MESCDYKVCGGDSIPFAQWSPETLGAGFVLPFALTNSECLPSALPTGETLPSFAAAAACPNPSHRQTKMGVTRKGCSHFCVEVAGFELLFWRSLAEGLFLESSKIKASMVRHTERYSKKQSPLWYGCGTIEAQNNLFFFHIMFIFSSISARQKCIAQFFHRTPNKNGGDFPAEGGPGPFGQPST